MVCIRIMIWVPSPLLKTGYAIQGAIWAPRFASLGHDVAIGAFAGLAGDRTTWNGIPLYPGGNLTYGQDVMAGHVKHFGADVVIVLTDAWALKDGVLKRENLGALAACWLPIDCQPLSGMDAFVLKDTGAVPIAMSRFGKKMLEEAGFACLYAPHGIETSVFCPGDKQAAREEIGLPSDAFVIGMNAANLDLVRKGFPEQFLAFSEFHKEHPGAILMAHTTINGTGRGGYDLSALATRLGITEAVRWSDQYAITTGGYSTEDMVTWYRALDVYSGCAWGGAFELPLVEAQACGIPVVTTAFSAMAENTGCGWLVPGDPFWNPPHASFWAKPRVGEIVEAYKRAAAGEEGQEPEVAREFALQFDADRVLKEHWVGCLAELEAML